MSTPREEQSPKNGGDWSYGKWYNRLESVEKTDCKKLQFSDSRDFAVSVG
jgi:hypothetical protein